MSGVYIRGLNIEPCDDGFDGKGLVIVGYDDKLYAVAHKDIVPVPDHGRLVDADALKEKAHYDDFDNAVVDVDDIDAAPTVIEADRSEDYE